MKIEKEHGWFPLVVAPECPTIPEVRRVARFFRRGGLQADLHPCVPNAKGEPEHTLSGPYADARPPYAWVLTTAHGEFERRLNDRYPYAIVDFEAMWEACEAMGFCVAAQSNGDHADGRSYELEAWNPSDRRDRFPFLTGRGETRASAMFALVWGLERLTRNWPMSCGRGGMFRPWAYLNRREEA